LALVIVDIVFLPIRSPPDLLKGNKASQSQIGAARS
jgi:hypothetical protein